jgi:hypothetical protein
MTRTSATTAHAASGGGGTTTEPFTYTASEELYEGSLVNIWYDGTDKVRLADNGLALHSAHGFVLANVAADDPATVYCAGINTAVTGNQPGMVLYLGTGGDTDDALPDATKMKQVVGVSLNAQGYLFTPGDSIPCFRPDVSGFGTTEADARMVLLANTEEEVTLFGNLFVPGLTFVRLDNVLIDPPPVVAPDGLSLTFTQPEHVSGTVPFVVMTPYGVVDWQDVSFYDPADIAEVTSVAPTSAEEDTGDQVVVITGERFETPYATGYIAFEVAGVPVSTFGGVIDSDTQITFTVPTDLAPVGLYDVVTYNSIGVKSTTLATFEVTAA